MRLKLNQSLKLKATTKMVILATATCIAGTFVFLLLFGYLNTGIQQSSNASTTESIQPDSTKSINEVSQQNEVNITDDKEDTVAQNKFIGESENDNLNAFPINLVSFTSKVHDDAKVLLNWVTAAEINNDYFTVYKSIDGLEYVEFEKIKSKGSSSNIQYYSMLDENPFPGISYYKLTQTDFNGQTFDLNSVKLEFNGYKKGSKIIIWPNPFIDKITMNIPEGFDNEVKVVIFELSGKIAIEATIAVNDYDSEIEITSLDKISPGQYILKVFRGSNVSEGVKIIKK